MQYGLNVNTKFKLFNMIKHIEGERKNNFSPFYIIFFNEIPSYYKYSMFATPYRMFNKDKAKE